MDYRIQRIHFKQRITHRILQNVGGPCPLIGLCNVLLLNNDIKVNKNKTIRNINFKDLTFCLRDHLQKLFELSIQNKTDINSNEEQVANAIQNIEDCVQLFPKLEEGLDINIKFNDVTSFEFTPAIAMFDAYNVRIIHGWIIDPQNTQLHKLIAHKSYNEVVDILTTDTDTNSSTIEQLQAETDREIIREFLIQYSQQLTSHGLIRMHEVMNENETAIFFRNNHYSTIYKHDGMLYELVSDEGFVDADPQITWQTLSEINGDIQFVNNKFQLIQQHNMQQQQAMNIYKQNMKQVVKDEEKKEEKNDDEVEEQLNNDPYYNQEKYLEKQKQTQIESISLDVNNNNMMVDGSYVNVPAYNPNISGIVDDMSNVHISHEEVLAAEYGVTPEQQKRAMEEVQRNQVIKQEQMLRQFKYEKEQQSYQKSIYEQQREQNSQTALSRYQKRRKPHVRESSSCCIL